MKTKKIICVLLVIFGVGCMHIKATENAVTPSKLNAEPARFDNQAVTVDGWLEFRPEAYRLWESEGAMASGMHGPNCVSIGAPGSVEPHRFNKKYVRVTGKFIADSSSQYILIGGCNEPTLILVKKIFEIK